MVSNIIRGKCVQHFSVRQHRFGADILIRAEVGIEVHIVIVLCSFSVCSSQNIVLFICTGVSFYPLDVRFSSQFIPERNEFLKEV